MADAKKEPVSGEAGFDPTKQPGYQEYPKALPGGQVVNSKEEEDAIVGGRVAGTHTDTHGRHVEPEPDPPKRR
jgi:hypothetical protein